MLEAFEERLQGLQGEGKLAHIVKGQCGQARGGKLGAKMRGNGAYRSAAAWRVCQAALAGMGPNQAAWLRHGVASIGLCRVYPQNGRKLIERGNEPLFLNGVGETQGVVVPEGHAGH